MLFRKFQSGRVVTDQLVFLESWISNYPERAGLILSKKHIYVSHRFNIDIYVAKKVPEITIFAPLLTGNGPFLGYFLQVLDHFLGVNI